MICETYNVGFKIQKYTDRYNYRTVSPPTHKFYPLLITIFFNIPVLAIPDGNYLSLWFMLPVFSFAQISKYMYVSTSSFVSITHMLSKCQMFFCTLLS